MTKPTLIRGARLFSDSSAGPMDILLADGRIQAVAAAGTITTAADVHDATGLLALPGLIDIHVHPIHDETFASVGDAAVHGGITTVGQHLYPAPTESFREALQRMEAEASQGTADFAAHVRWDPSRQEDLEDLVDAGGASVKAFLAHPDKAVQAELHDLVEVMQKSAAAGIPTLVHAELGSVVDRIADAGFADRSTLAGIHAWRSTHNEAAAVTAAASVARAVGAHLYVVHVSCAEALAACEVARAQGTQITVETCPHYLFLTRHDAPPGGQGFVLPPLRDESDRQAIRSALVRGVVDTVGSDHCGHSPANKRPDDLLSAKAGLPGIELLSRLLIDAAVGPDAWLTPSRVEDVLATGPSRTFQLQGKGALKPGYDADVVLIDPTAVELVDHNGLHDAATYSPYQGRTLHGRIERVWRRGELVLDGGARVAVGGGRLVRRNPRVGNRRTPATSSIGAE